MSLIRKIKEWLGQFGAEAGVAEPRGGKGRSRRPRDQRDIDALRWE